MNLTLALLRREHAVVLSPETQGSDLSMTLGSLILEQGFMPGASLRAALRRAGAGTEASVREAITAMGLLRGDAPSLPQLRDFVRTQGGPRGTLSLERRLLAFLGEDQDATSLFGEDDQIALDKMWANPAASERGCFLMGGPHLCATGRLGSAMQGACEICHMRAETSESAQLAAEDRTRRADRALPRTLIEAITPDQLPARLTRAAHALASLTRPLSEDERADLLALHGALLGTELDATTSGRRLEAADVPQREVRALLLGQLWDVSPEQAGAVARSWKATVSDVLRLVDVIGGGSGTLARAPLAQEPATFSRSKRPKAPHVRLSTLSRQGRRVIASLLDAQLAHLTPDQGWEQISEYAEAFKRLMAKLHVHELKAPTLQAYAALLSGNGADRLREPARAEYARLTAAGAPRSFLSRVEGNLSAGDLAGALDLLGQRPGMLARMADRLIREEAGQKSDQDTIGQAPMVTAALRAALPALKPELVAGLATHFAGRTQPVASRNFRARGSAAQRSVSDQRPLLSEALTQDLRGVMQQELISRGSELPGADILEIDPNVLGYRVGLSARHSSGGNEGLAQGSRMRLTPAGDVPAKTARLFMHWAQPEGTYIDLDLSASVYSAQGQQIQHCSFHSLRTPGMVHSGDLRSAPLPTGATEYIDLDLDTLRAMGGHLVIASVHSFTGLPFNQMVRASTGLMVRRDTAAGAREMDPATTRVRFNLTGDVTSVLLLAIELGQQAGDEQVVYLESPGDSRGLQLLSRDTRVNLAQSLIKEAQGSALTELLEPHLTRVQHARCGEHHWSRQDGETAREFAGRVRLALEGLSRGQLPLQGAGTCTGERIIRIQEQFLTAPEGEAYALQGAGEVRSFGALLSTLVRP